MLRKLIYLRDILVGYLDGDVLVLVFDRDELNVELTPVLDLPEHVTLYQLLAVALLDERATVPEPRVTTNYLGSVDVAKHPIVTDLGEGVYGHSLIPKDRVHRVRLVDEAVIQGHPHLPRLPPRRLHLLVELVVLAPVVHAVVNKGQVLLL
jgi:hypothetical protein